MTATEHVRRGRGLPPAFPLSFGPLGVGQAQLITGAGVWCGESIEETTGAASARAVLLDQDGAGAGVTLGPFTLGASGSRNDPPNGNGVWFTRGLRLNVTAGSVAGVLYVVLVTPDQLAELLWHPPGIGD